MRTARSIPILLVGVAGFFCLGSLKALDIFSVSAAGLNSLPSATGFDNFAMQFQTKSDIIQASSFVAPLFVDTSSSIVSYSIYNDSGSNTPGSTLIADGSATVSNTIQADITFSFNAFHDLQPSTNYWLVFYKPNDGRTVFLKYGSLSVATRTEDYANLTGFIGSAFPHTSPPFSGWLSQNRQDTIAGTLSGVLNPVPEPSTHALGAIATAVLTAAARRRKSCKH